MAPLAPSSGTRASAAVPNNGVVEVCVIIAASAVTEGQASAITPTARARMPRAIREVSVI